MKNRKKIILTTTGGILIAICFFKFSIIGYYQSEMPFYLLLLGVAAVLLFLASKIPSTIESTVPPQADRGQL